jgi:cell division protein FtsL
MIFHDKTKERQKMYRLRDRFGAVNDEAPQKPILAAKRHRQLHPFFFRMGPASLSMSSVLLIGLMAILYLSQLGQAVAINQRLQDLRSQQAVLQRENQDLIYEIAQEQSPAYIAEHAKSLGLVPADPKSVHVLVVPHLQPIPTRDQHIQP